MSREPFLPMLTVRKPILQLRRSITSSPRSSVSVRSYSLGFSGHQSTGFAGMLKRARPFPSEVTVVEMKDDYAAEANEMHHIALEHLGYRDIAAAHRRRCQTRSSSQRTPSRL